MQMLVNIDVPDLEAAIAFYRDALGLRLGRRLGDDGAEMLGGSAPLYLLEKEAGSVTAGDDTRSYRRHWTPVHLDMVVEDVEKSVEQAVAAGAKLESPTRVNDWGAIAGLADPFGHGFCLLAFRGRGYDEISD
ncbi:VOC family protein [Microbulbifer sediminum]|uniref:VOC family protein n=1 Tax=Microbulbifer sediminum TaxID=2904250 RepID=UPI001F460F2D|nr:VOC family protein [Microbulbifer sediminum]